MTGKSLDEGQMTLSARVNQLLTHRVHRQNRLGMAEFNNEFTYDLQRKSIANRTIVDYQQISIK